jgi:hypothetical protein
MVQASPSRHEEKNGFPVRLRKEVICVEGRECNVAEAVISSLPKEAEKDCDLMNWKFAEAS